MNEPQFDEPQFDEPHPELLEAKIGDLQRQMASGASSSVALTRAYLERITAIDPKILSVIEVNPDVLSIAAELDLERQQGKVRGPLHGIPILVKDNLETCDEMLTTAGSLALVDAPRPQKDAFVVQQLRKAGAVILGKTNLSEWSNFRSTQSISGWSGRGGQTNNPYVLDCNPCGSSSGTGAAISANLAVAGIGTETNGSIICPSVKCGLVGIKPTLGLVSRSGIIPIAHSQDTAGPMARTVEDAAILLGALVGFDTQDAITAQSTHGLSDYTVFLKADALQGARIGVARQCFGKELEVLEIMEKHLEVLQAAGATWFEITFPEVPGFDDDELEVLLTEFKVGLNSYLAGRGSAYQSLADLIAFNQEHASQEMPIFGQELFEQAEATGGLETESYLGALARIKRATQQDGIDAVMAKDNLDGIVSLSSGGAWSIPAIAGYPCITVPAGFFQGLPIGVSFFGRAFSEPKLIGFAYAFEQLTQCRQPPRFLPTLQTQ